MPDTTATSVRRELASRGVSEAQMTTRENINSLIKLRGAKANPANFRSGQIDVMVHGTYARGSDWTQPSGDFARRIASGRRTLTTRFEWSGGATENDRRTAGTQLSRFLNDAGGAKLYRGMGAATSNPNSVRRDFGLNVVAHSHGGNVLGHAMENTRAFVRSAFLLGTPAMSRHPNPNVSWSTNALRRVGNVFNIYSNRDRVQQELAQYNEGNNVVVGRQLNFPNIPQNRRNYQNIRFNPMNPQHDIDPYQYQGVTVHSELHNQATGRLINDLIRQN
ncbi:hypothetical protein [Chitinimonas koreensis]|uniref:hypothetical protein n=1 Tax=Chitinimonas koreensis TaxID=356302 RepID=UPI0012F729F6|nr:hypothetical protein [Chitinimonas koreensis]QNM96789.1 hypothetical protein H9L41_00020 [Chitinimonas koreensis]